MLKASNKYGHSNIWWFTDDSEVLQGDCTTRVKDQFDEKYIRPRMFSKPSKWPRLKPKTGTWQTVVTMRAEPQSFSLSLLPVIEGKRIKQTIVQGPFSLDQINQTWGNTIFRQGRHFKITERENGKWVVLIRGPSSGVVGICMPFGFLHLMWVLGLHAQTENYTLAHIKS